MVNRAALRREAYALTEQMTEWMKNKLIYHARIDHDYVMPPEMAHNLAAHVVVAQIETMLRAMDAGAQQAGGH